MPRSATDAWKRRLGRWRKNAPVLTSLAPYARLCAQVEAQGPQLQQLTDQQLRAAARAVWHRVREEGTEGHETDVAAVVREVAARTVGLRPYPVQLLAGLALADGRLVEMQTLSLIHI